MIASIASMLRFLEEERFIEVTDFAKCLKPRHKNGKKRK